MLHIERWGRIIILIELHLFIWAGWPDWGNYCLESNTCTHGKIASSSYNINVSVHVHINMHMRSRVHIYMLVPVCLLNRVSLCMDRRLLGGCSCKSQKGRCQSGPNFRLVVVVSRVPMFQTLLTFICCRFKVEPSFQTHFHFDSGALPLPVGSPLFQAFLTFMISL